MIDDLPPLREVVRRHGLQARRALGQNFLFDLNLTLRIARAAAPLEDATVVEIGPGPGGLTRALLAAGAARVVAVERDRRFLPALEEIGARYPGRLEVIEADALNLDLVSRLPAGRTRIVANLPYNVGTELLARWLETEPWPPWFDMLVLMFQREVAERVVATPADARNYGRLGVLAGWRSEARILFDVPPSAFVPPPDVTSSVVRLLPRAAPLPCSAGALAAVTRAAFGQRRKMLRQSLKPVFADPAAALAALGIDATLRAENIAIGEFVAIANAASARRGDQARA